jgi:hypothetical protein
VAVGPVAGRTRRHGSGGGARVARARVDRARVDRAGVDRARAGARVGVDLGLIGVV